MRILQVTPAFYPARGYGGAPLVVYEISKRLVQKGHDVTVYTTDANDETSRFDSGIVRNNNVEIHYFKNISNYLAYKHKLFVSLNMIRTISKEINNFDVIHLHDTRTLQNIITYYFAKKHRIPYVVQPHGTISSQTNNKNNLKNVFDLFFGSKIMKNINKLIVLNETVAEKCMENDIDEERIEIIPNGIDPSVYARLPQKGLFREKYKISSNHRVILYLGRIHRSKGIDLLIKTFVSLSKKIDGVRLVVAGSDDGYLDQLRHLSNSLGVSDKVVFTGFISEREKLSAYVDADVFVTPSFYGFPLTFLETMACGLPMVTTNKGDFIKGIDNEFGYVVEYQTQKLENAILRIITDDELREKFSRIAKEKVQDYDWNRVTSMVEKVYRTILGECT